MLKILQRKRKSDLVWLSDPWIYKEIHPYVHHGKHQCWLEFSMGFF